MMKKKMNAVLALSTICWLSFAGIVSAGSQTKTGAIDGVDVHANSSAFASYATASTAAGTYDYGVIAKVSSHYIYTNLYTGTSYGEDMSVEGNSSASNTFNAPQNHRTVSIAADHMAKKNGQTWTTSTFAAY